MVRNHTKRRERDAQFVRFNGYAMALHVHRVRSGGPVEKLPLASMKHGRIRGCKAHNAVAQVFASYCVNDLLHKEFRRREDLIRLSRVYRFRRDNEVVHGKFRHQGP